MQTVMVCNLCRVMKGNHSILAMYEQYYPHILIQDPPDRAFHPLTSGTG